jgi:hypothetical protein
MKHSRLRYFLLAGLFAIPALAHAHPGHDGEHDFEWDFGHFVSHPFATVACAALLAGAGWGAWRLIASRAGSRTALTKRN